MPTRKVDEYLEPGGAAPFAKWFARLDALAAAKVATALYRMEQGNLSNVKPVGQGVVEYRIDFGAGYLIYIGQDGNVLIILLGGGSKKGQSADIQQAQQRREQLPRSGRDYVNASITFDGLAKATRLPTKSCAVQGRSNAAGGRKSLAASACSGHAATRRRRASSRSSRYCRVPNASGWP